MADVSIVKTGKGDAEGAAGAAKAIKQAVDLVGGIKKFIKKGDKVLVKPNYNSDDPPPASSDPKFVKTCVDMILDAGASEVAIGESSGPYWKPTMKVLKKMGLLDVAEETGVEVLDFDNLPRKYMKMPSKARHLKGLHMPEALERYNKLVYICCMKTHRNARFTMALKLAMGFPKTYERVKMHINNLEPKIAELNLLVKPDLIIMDGRKAFVTGGPDTGREEEPGVVLASTDRVAIDIEALKLLKQYDSNNRLDMPVEELPLIAESIRLGTGKKGKAVTRR